MPEPSEEHPDPRGELNDTLLVEQWLAPGQKVYVSTEPGAPSWWRGEEEATESFFRSMGIRLGPDGEVIKT